MIKTHQLDVLAMIDDPARDYPYTIDWVLTPTTDPDVAPNYRHARLELWAPDPEHPGEGICIARLSDGIRPQYGLLLVSGLQATWPEIAEIAARIIGAARQGRASGFRRGSWQEAMKEAVDDLDTLSPTSATNDVLLWCKHCDWCGSLYGAGWDPDTQEWTCPDCGGAEWIRILGPTFPGVQHLLEWLRERAACGGHPPIETREQLAAWALDEMRIQIEQAQDHPEAAAERLPFAARLAFLAGTLLHSGAVPAALPWASRDDG